MQTMYKSIRKPEVLDTKVQKLLKNTGLRGSFKTLRPVLVYEFNFGYLRNYVKQVYIK